MEVNNIYYQKYLKYKSKYIELKKLIGGAIKCKGNNNIGCLHNCTNFIKDKLDKEYCENCSHHEYWHQKV